MNTDLPPAGGPTTGPATTPSGTSSGGSPDGASGPIRTMNDFFGWIRGFGIYRPSDGRWGAGVAAGLSRRWNIDPILVRGIFVALTLAGGLGIALYGLGWLLLPQADGRIHLQQAMHGHFSAGFVGAAILSLALIGSPGHTWFDGPPRFLAVIGLVALIWWMHRHRDEGSRYTAPAQPVAPAHADIPEYGTPESRSASGASASAASASAPASVQDPVRPGSHSGTPASQMHWHSGTAATDWTPSQKRPVPPPRPDLTRPSHRITRVTLGLALLTGAVIGILRQGSDSWQQPAALIGAAAALGVVGAGIVFAGLSGRRSGGLAFFGIVLSIAVLLGAGVHQAGVRSGQTTALVGNHYWAPSTLESAQGQFNLGAGQGELRLTDSRLYEHATAADPVRVSVRMGAGELRLDLPEDVATSVTIRLGAGELIGPDGKSTSIDPGNRDDSAAATTSRRIGPSGEPRLIVDVKQGVGQVVLSAGPMTGPQATPALTTTPAPSASASTTAAKKEKEASK